ncbi:uncharacterized protein LOC110269975 [Arachis ipaensis]|uniref:uncharacterized protein LOC110269975 n=1 Tax=Arachis ipaensis TaxID=130454 RepID=UPI000A2B8E93|nr:uncharacterized protein LOC110269975 [Arachis ipaensis]XP_020973871.1 uncharacterized protein LOC110269975 [Arachis ipaensis]QHN99808.1 uncharacterized protein DS421_13g401060 [Arachis hypogaea]
MESQEKEEGLELEVQQKEESEVCEPEERKGELGETDQDEDSIIDDFLSSLVNPLNEPNEPLSIEFEGHMEVDFSQHPCYDLSDGEEKVGEEATPFQEHIEWVAISPLSFIGLHQYAILETDYQLKVLLGLLHGEKRSVGCRRSPRLIKKANSSFGIQAWCEARFSDLRRVLGYFKGQLGACPSVLEHKNPQKGERKTRIWDPRGALKCKLGWRFKEEWKHKPS